MRRRGKGDRILSRTKKLGKGVDAKETREKTEFLLEPGRKTHPDMSSVKNVLVLGASGGFGTLFSQV